MIELYSVFIFVYKDKSPNYKTDSFVEKIWLLNVKNQVSQEVNFEQLKFNKKFMFLVWHSVLKGFPLGQGK